MKVFVKFAVLVLVIAGVCAIDLMEEAYILMPFMKFRQPPPPCSVNEFYKTCTGMCSDCEQRGRCAVTTCEKGCDCAPNFYRVTPDGPCEPVANCPKPECDEHEVFRECGPTCERCTFMRCRSISCEHKCYCKEGYLRNENGVCIPAEECPKREHCFRHEEWAESGLEDEYCPMSKNKTASSKIQNVTRCYCMEGYRRNLFGHCIEEKRCPTVHCFGEEVYQECIPKCNTTCRSYGDPDCTEDDNCYPGCFCQQGYVMNDLGSCILQKECSLDISQVKLMNQTDVDEESDTTPNPLQNFTEVEDSAGSNSTGESVEEYTTDSEGTTMTPTSQSFTVTESSPVTEAAVDSKTTLKKTKTSPSESKHENVAKAKAVQKEEIPTDDEFDNEEV